MQSTRTEIIKNLNKFKNEYWDIKAELQKYLQIDELKQNPEINELLHMKIYEVNKIIESFNNNIDKLSVDSTYECNKDRIHEFFNDKLMNKFQELISNLKYQLNILETNLN